jgi:TrmH family RNA methyltransferase
VLPPVTSPSNPLVKELRLLHRPVGRRESSLFLAEGRRCCDGLLQAGLVPRELLVPQDAELPPAWPDVLIRPVSPKVFERVSQASSPSGWLGVFERPAAEDLDASRPALVAVDVADPGNLGTLLRSAAAFGVQQALIVGGADPFGHKAVQASAGVLGAVHLHRWEADEAPDRLPAEARLVALAIDGQSLADASPGAAAWVVVGSEAHGLNDRWRVACAEAIRLPMAAGVESLNAGVAGSVALWELWGRRLGESPP